MPCRRQRIRGRPRAWGELLGVYQTPVEMPGGRRWTQSWQPSFQYPGRKQATKWKDEREAANDGRTQRNSLVQPVPRVFKL